MFSLGFISGLLTALIILVIEIYLRMRNKGLETIERAISEKLRPQAVIIKPRSERDRQTEELIKNNEKKGLSTNIEEL